MKALESRSFKKQADDILTADKYGDPKRLISQNLLGYSTGSNNASEFDALPRASQTRFTRAGSNVKGHSI